MFFVQEPVPEYSAKIYGTYPWIIEAIDEQFDNALCNLDPEVCFIYGGAVRDIIAGMPVMGDLDIIVEGTAFLPTVNMFRYSERWNFKNMTSGAEYAKPSPQEKTSSSTIMQIATFYNNSRSELQLMEPQKAHKALTDTIPCSRAVWDVVQSVDIRCCGVLLSLSGELYEVVPGAMDDCHKRQLCENQSVEKTVINGERLRKRVAKLIKRGWCNTINLDKYPEKQQKTGKPSPIWEGL